LLKPILSINSYSGCLIIYFAVAAVVTLILETKHWTNNIYALALFMPYNSMLK